MESMGRDELEGPRNGRRVNGGNGDPSNMHSHPCRIDVLEDFELSLAGWRWTQDHLAVESWPQERWLQERMENRGLAQGWEGEASEC